MEGGRVKGTDLILHTLAGGKQKIKDGQTVVTNVSMGVGVGCLWELYDGEPGAGGSRVIKFANSATVCTPVVFPFGLDFIDSCWVTQSGATSGSITIAYK